MSFLKKIGIEKKDKTATPPQAKKTVKSKDAQAHGIGRGLAKLGVNSEQVKSKDEQAADERHTNILLAWQYLRHMIDKGVKEYYATGVSPILEQHVERPTLDALREHLSELRSQGIYWEQPKRRVATSPQPTIVDEHLDSEGVPVQFTIRERFRDFSLFQQLEQDPMTNETRIVDERRAEGTERAILATVKVLGDENFRLVTVERATDATF